MSGHTLQGFPYPDPTDPLAEGADAIKALAQAVDGLVALGQTMIGGYTAGKPVRRLTGWTAGTADANGLSHLGLALNATAILAAHITPTWAASNNQNGWFPQIRVDLSSVTDLVFQVMAAPATPIGTIYLSFAYTIDYQSSAATTRPGADDE